MSVQAVGFMRPWPPTTFVRLVESLDTSMGTARIQTDAGPAYIKALGNRQGPHQLACELVGTALAGTLGLPILDYALFDLDETVDRLILARGVRARSGPAFVTRAAPQLPWGGSPQELRRLVNPECIALLVVFDTWTRNCDRYPPDVAKRRPNYDNVFLERLPKHRLRLIAMDHSCCFTCNQELQARALRRIDWTKDEGIYGVFPGLEPYLRPKWVRAAVARLASVEVKSIQAAVASVPAAWEVSDDARAALVESLVERARFVAATIGQKLGLPKGRGSQ